MLDLAYIRDHADEVRAAMATLNTEAPLEEALRLDRERREVLSEVENLRNKRNTISKEIPRTKDAAQRQALVTESRTLGEHLKTMENRLNEIEPALRDVLLRIPNLPDPDVPVGKDENENVITRHWGTPKPFDFQPKPHWEIGEALGILDFERGVKLSGSRFYVLKAAGARLQRALITWMLDLHINKHGYTEIYPPYMVKEDCLVGTGQLPKFADNLYHDAEEDYWWIPTAEVPVTNLFREEIMPAGKLPINYVAYTPCFRREKMSAGRDVRGIKRGHQFDKVEMVKFVEPDTSKDELQKLLGNAEEVAQLLNLPYRIVQMCTGDLSFTAAEKYDIEVWAPGVQEWLEVSSCSNFHDFQARRANIRYRPGEGTRTQFVHTLNGSGLALPRVMISVLETYQQADGSVQVPEVLRPYMGGMAEIRET